MKVRIKYYNFELVEYLTYGKEYDAEEYMLTGMYVITNDIGVETIFKLNNSSHLNGGSWELIE